MTAKINAILVKQLRDRTGVGLMECKKALVESNNDIELAIDIMRKAGRVKAAKTTSRLTSEGSIFISDIDEKQYGVMVEINCETDFVSKNALFREFGKTVLMLALRERVDNLDALRRLVEEKRTELVFSLGENINIQRFFCRKSELMGVYRHGDRIGVMVTGKRLIESNESRRHAQRETMKHIAMHIAASRPEYLHPDHVPADILFRERQIQLELASQSRKPSAIVKKMVEGRMRKFTHEISLSGQPFIMDSKKTVGQLLNEHHIRLKSFARFEIGDSHNGIAEKKD